jgi:hypothetical protein
MIICFNNILSSPSASFGSVRDANEYYIEHIG